MNKFIKCLVDPFYGCSKVLNRLAPLISNDELYVKLDYFFAYKHRLNLDNPQLYGEKLQWLKLYDRNPVYSMMVDKYVVKEYIGKLIGPEHIIPTLGVWERFDDIDFDELPNQFVLKCTHDSGGLVICKDKLNLDIDKTRIKISKCLKRNYFIGTREYPYKNVKPRVLAEKYMEDNLTQALVDYKVLCFNGRAKLIELYLGRYSKNLTLDFYDTNWVKTTLSQGTFGPNSDVDYPRPVNLERMIELSEVIAKDMAHCRVDWYEINGRLFFGEITFYDGSGLSPFDDIKDELVLGSWIDLSRAYNQKG